MSPMKGRRARRGAARARFFPAHLNLHDLPVRPGMLLAMADQHRGPWRATHLRSSSSSCLVGGRGGGEWAAGRRAGMSARENTQQTSTPEKTSPPPPRAARPCAHVWRPRAARELLSIRVLRHLAHHAAVLLPHSGPLQS